MIATHLVQCAQARDPTYALKVEINKLKQENHEQKEIILILQNENKAQNLRINQPICTRTR